MQPKAITLSDCFVRPNSAESPKAEDGAALKREFTIQTMVSRKN